MKKPCFCYEEINLLFDFPLISQVSLEQKLATVTFDHNQQSPDSLSVAIEDMGFESSPSQSIKSTQVSTDTHLIPTSGLTLSGQKEALEMLSQVKGVLDVSRTTGETALSVTFVPFLTSALQLTELVTSFKKLTEVPTPNCPDPKAPNLYRSQENGGGMSIMKMNIEGMTCHSCTNTIEGKIGKLKGIERIKGDVNRKCCNTVAERFMWKCTFHRSKVSQVSL